MHNQLLKMYVKFQNLVSGEEGQDLVEYGLLCTLIALSMISGVSHVATAVTHIFTNVSTSLA
jgi:Flp pilus assembly pilin Flp